MLEAQVWEAIRGLDGQAFLTAKGLPFTVKVRGNEMFISRKDKSITRSTVAAAYQRMRAQQAKSTPVDGPKKLGTFGASYLYPIFIRLGWIEGKRAVQMSLCMGASLPEYSLSASQRTDAEKPGNQAKSVAAERAFIRR